MVTSEAFAFNHVGIMVTDIDAAVEWYTEHLGMVVSDRWENEESDMKWAHLTMGHLTIEFVQRNGLGEPAAGAAGYHHIAVTAASAQEATRSLEAAGGTVVFPPSHFERHDMDWSFVRDPFGNIIEVISYRSPE
jgi:catechol 2,3-dioxygenase-like lactoylglutathione lyase family enzyme